MTSEKDKGVEEFLEGKLSEKTLKWLIQHHKMKASLQEAIQYFMDKRKRDIGSDNDYCTLSEGENDGKEKRGKKKRKTKYLKKKLSSLGYKVGHSTIRKKGVLSSRENSYVRKGVLSGTLERGVHSCTQGVTDDDLEEEFLESDYTMEEDQNVDE
ncbi:hypothetical protein NDU88_003294 [Pleurodeles waltl]|uniref:Uncharacterized protein n=1 Tax=Pleurodeles waltl TaxID=8319 RepID=A0AAV7UC42_PLEWA|nr:hypothetical protein NDU88_003294 [Pleurodeles waltl]